MVLTGAAGFIGFHLARRLLSEGARVVGIDNLNASYDPALKRARLAELSPLPGFAFHALDITDATALADLVRREAPEVVIHLAAQAGVRQSIDRPFDYAGSNLLGHLAVLEACRHLRPMPRLVYASSSSVYGTGAALPFRESDAADRPASLYAATKRSGELMSDSYAHLFGLPQVGLRFFTVYGPWGRPDMAAWRFADRILAGRPVPLFNGGDLRRDFTYVDDIVAGLLSVAMEPLRLPEERPHRIYNLGSGRPVALTDFIELLERAIGRPAIRAPEPMQPGDVRATAADISALARDHGYRPSVSLEVGVGRFIDWFKARYPHGVHSPP
ncbi:NAD-dependent epimerase/dehydratase family protein [Aureimonas sp. AU40]|uniref:NAD-dependent epimerase/dehydratase family protein n=1 Tax=Aureimonas sp. AU40 TaxID=1637747 RepID=UPI000780E5F4|nr:NAD-dependent epimerase/dehydratase family protein [Aureimonas sp. AU40]